MRSEFHTQRETRGDARKTELDTHKLSREYSFYLRLAFASTMECPVEYYSAPAEMWDPPEHGSPFNAEQIRAILGESALTASTAPS